MPSSSAQQPEGEDGRALEARGAGVATTAAATAAEGQCGGARQQQDGGDDDWASRLWMENGHWALLAEHHPDRCVGWMDAWAGLPV